MSESTSRSRGVRSVSRRDRSSGTKDGGAANVAIDMHVGRRTSAKLVASGGNAGTDQRVASVECNMSDQWPEPATCDFRFSLQNRYAGERLLDGLTTLHVSNRAVTLSGRATLSGKDMSKEDFVAAREQAIRSAFANFLDVHDLPCADDLVILDMEPEKCAPRHLGDFKDAELAELVRAYKLRIHIARQELQDRQIPRLQLGLYQVIVPDGRGRNSPSFQRRMTGYRQAGCLGMYDELDFICPVLYHRFGVADADPATIRQWVARSTRQAIEGSLELTRSDGGRIPLVPILSFWVLNGGSSSDRCATLPDAVALQIEELQRSIGIAAILFWSGWQTKHEMETAKDPVEAIHLIRFMEQTGSLPWPGCP